MYPRPLPMIAVALLALAAAACSGSDRGRTAPGDSPPKPPSATCQVDGDCVPAQCCHATTCTTRAQAPDCKGVMCTLECRLGTLDCSGKCTCQQGACKAHIEGIEAPAAAPGNKTPSKTPSAPPSGS